MGLFPPEMLITEPANASTYDVDFEHDTLESLYRCVGCDIVDSCDKALWRIECMNRVEEEGERRRRAREMTTGRGVKKRKRVELRVDI